MSAAAAEQIKDVNIRYHDGAATDYDAKWNIRFDDDSEALVVDKLRKTLGKTPQRFERALEIGAGTGYFGLNLIGASVIGEEVATDISQGMLDALATTAEKLAYPVETACCEASELPFPDDSFDLVLGHAVLHHLPHLEQSFAEFKRVLKPGGVIAFCGEPSLYGDRLAKLPKRTAMAIAPVWRRLIGASQRPAGRDDHEGHELEGQVDVHTFTPKLLRGFANAAGFEQVRVGGEELASSAFGWLNRTLEATADPDRIPDAWKWYAYLGYMGLRQVDRRLLEPTLPPEIFYNLMISARVPG